MTSFMAAIGIYNQDYGLAGILLLACSCYFFSFYLYTRLSKKTLSANVLTYSLYILMFYLVYSGGVASTGILWLYIVAPVTIYIRGLKRGIFDTAVFLLIVAAIMNVPPIIPHTHEYPSEFKFRFFLSFLTVTFLSGMYEYSREQWYKHTMEVTEKYQTLAHYDALTNIFNRRHAVITLEQEQSRLSRGAAPVSILLCDLDHFKMINDKYGHIAGDKVLSELSAVFQSSIRSQDTVARWGGEEFIFILPQTTIEQAEKAAKKLLAATRAHVVNVEDTAISTTISIGVESLTVDCSIDDCINSADKKLYRAKSLGRDQACSESE